MLQGIHWEGRQAVSPTLIAGALTGHGLYFHSLEYQEVILRGVAARGLLCAGEMGN